MPTGNPPTRHLVPFESRKALSKVKRVRDIIRAEAEEIYRDYRAALKLAVAAGQYEAALKGYAWLVGHAPADEEGVRMVDSDVDKQAEAKGQSGPVIQIGFSLGGIDQKKLPEAAIIDVRNSDSEE